MVTDSDASYTKVVKVASRAETPVRIITVLAKRPPVPPDSSCSPVNMMQIKTSAMQVQVGR